MKSSLLRLLFLFIYIIELIISLRNIYNDFPDSNKIQCFL